MSATRLLVLGSIRQLGRAHGYQVRADLRERGVHLWAKIQQGSIYHALRTLTRDGLLEVVAEDRQSPAGPARTEYAITETGDAAFHSLLEHALRSHEGDISETIAGIGCMTELPRERVIALLGERVDAYRRWRQQVVGVYEQAEEDFGHHVEAVRLWAHTADSAIGWTVELIERLEAGAYTMLGETPSSVGPEPSRPVPPPANPPPPGG